METTRETTTRAGVRLTPRGYALGVGCDLGHSGNRGLYPDQGFFACQGCGKWYARSVVAAMQAESAALAAARREDG